MIRLIFVGGGRRLRIEDNSSCVSFLSFLSLFFFFFFYGVIVGQSIERIGCNIVCGGDSACSGEGCIGNGNIGAASCLLAFPKFQSSLLGARLPRTRYSFSRANGFREILLLNLSPSMLNWAAKPTRARNPRYRSPLYPDRSPSFSGFNP